MPENKKPQIGDERRRQAEDRLKETHGRLPPHEPGDDHLRLLHELQVHQLELETQNAELRQAKNDLEALLDKYTDLYDFSPVGYLTLDRSGKILSANLTCARFLESERSGLTGRHLKHFITAEDRPDFSAFLEKVYSQPIKEASELALQQKDNSLFFVQVEALSAPSGQECRMAVIDVSERKLAEENFLRVEKLQSLGVLAGGIAHDLNNFLAVILGNLSLARAQVHDPGRLNIRLNAVEKAAHRARDLSLQLLTFAKGGVPVKKSINLGDIINDAANLAILKTSTTFKVILPDSLYPVVADAGQIRQVIYNLVLYAVHSISDQGKIVITVKNSELSATGERFVQIAIKDSGPGLSDETMRKIFDPYFSPNLNGSGIGLAASYSIIRKHNGNLMVNSKVGKGTTFHISLPAEEHAFPTKAVAKGEYHYGQGRILLMDDEESIRETTRASLEELGYLVEVTQDGAEAVQLYQRRKAEETPFAAIILDLTVPGGMGGKKAMELIRQFDSTAKAVVSSGYSTDPIMANFEDFGFNAVLSKPYGLEELSRVLKDLLV